MTSSSSSDTSRTPLPGVALGDELLVDVFDRADVESARRLHGDEQLRVLIDFAGHDGLLLVAAGHAPRDGDGALAGADVILLDEPCRIGADIGAPEEAGLVRKFRLEIPLEHQIVLERIVQHESVLVPVFGDVAEAHGAALADGHVRDVAAQELDLAGRDGFESRQAVDEFGLAVALDAREADDLAAMHLSDTPRTALFLWTFEATVRFSTFKTASPSVHGCLSTFEADLAAHHHRRELLCRGGAGVDRADIFALAEHRTPVGDGHDLRELVGDEEDGLPLRREIFS